MVTFGICGALESEDVVWVALLALGDYMNITTMAQRVSSSL